MRTILALLCRGSIESASQTAPSGPAAIPPSGLSPKPKYLAVIAPAVVICTTLLEPPPFTAVNQSAPSGPEAIKPGVKGGPGGKGRGYSVKAPAVVIRQMLPEGLTLSPAVNHRAPSEPGAIA